MRPCRGRFETGTYQCEALPDFSSVGFRKTLCRLLDILEEWKGPVHPGKGAVSGPRSSKWREPERENVGMELPRSSSERLEAERRATAGSREGVSSGFGWRRRSHQKPEESKRLTVRVRP